MNRFGREYDAVLVGLLSDGPSDAEYRRGLLTLRRCIGAASVWSVRDVVCLAAGLASVRPSVQYRRGLAAFCAVVRSWEAWG